MSTDASELNPWRRLHPLSPIFQVGKMLRAAVVPVVFVVFAAGSVSGFTAWALGAVVVTIIGYAIRNLLMRYRVTDDDLVIRDGLLFRKERHVPIERINNVDLVQSPLMRVLKVAEARFQTAGGGEAEAVLKVLAVADVERIQQRLAQTQGVGTTDASEREERGRVLLRLPPGELIRLGLISNRGVVILAAAFGLLWETNLISFDNLEERFDSLSGQLEISPGPWGTVLAVGVFLLLLMIFSVVWTFLRFGEYELRRDGNDFRLSCGLLKKHSATIPRDRIRFVAVRATPLHRLFRRVAVRVETGGGVADQDSNFGRVWFAPLVRPGELAGLLDDLGVPRLETFEWHTLPRVAAWRATKKLLLVSIIPMFAGVCIALWLPRVGVSVLCVSAVLFGVSILFARAGVRLLRWSDRGGVMATRTGVLMRVHAIAMSGAPQVVTLTESPFDRRHEMVTMSVDTPGAGPAGTTISVPYLLRDDAVGVSHRLVGIG